MEAPVRTKATATVIQTTKEVRDMAILITMDTEMDREGIQEALERQDLEIIKSSGNPRISMCLKGLGRKQVNNLGKTG